MTQLALQIPVPPARGRMPSEPIVRSAEISTCAFGHSYRWLARRAWGSGPCIYWNLLNPSLADGKRDDPTMLRMMGFSYRWGFGSMIVGNVYPYIASKPIEVTRWRRRWNEPEARSMGYSWDLLPTTYNAWIHNIHKVTEAMGEATEFVAAWGNGADEEDLKNFLLGVGIPVPFDEETGDPACVVKPRWKCLGLTKSGAPVHPLARGRHRIPDDAQLREWSASQ